MSAVGIEEAAAIRPQHLDSFLRSDWSLRDGLGGDGIHHGLATLVHNRLTICANSLHLLRFDKLYRVIRFQILHNSLGDQNQCINSAHRYEDPKKSSGQVYPEIADGLLLTPRYSPDEGNRECDTGRRGSKIVISQTSHLGEITHGRLTRVVLPVCVSRERRGGIEG